MSENGYVAVVNFERFQHYKDRNPPWIKLHAALLDDYEFGRLQDASKMHLVGIWILASKTDNHVPADPEWITKRIGARTKVDLEVLISAGFLVRLRRASDALADGKQSARLEEESRGETEGPPVRSEDEGVVLGHYRKVHPKRLRGAVPEKTLRLLRKALKDYSPADLCQAIDGNAGDQFCRDGNHMGLDLILRDADHIDRYMAKGSAPETVEMTDEFGVMRLHRRDNSGNWVAA